MINFHLNNLHFTDHSVQNHKIAFKRFCKDASGQVYKMMVSADNL